MKTVSENELKNLIGSEPNYQAPTGEVTATIEQKRAVWQATLNLFEQLELAFPAWFAAFKTEKARKDVRAFWGKTLLESGITPAQIQVGLNVAIQSESDFFPSVGKFMGWCRNGNPHAELSLPTPDELMSLYNKLRNSMCEDLARYPWKSAVEFHLVSQLKRAIYDGNLDTETALKRAKDIIDRTAKRLQAGEQFAPPSAPKLDKPKSAPISTERQLAHIANLKAILGRSTRQVVLQ